jgi:hypothetical protein
MFNHHNHLNQEHVIAKLKQLQNVEIHQLMDLPDVETMKLQHVLPDVIQLTHLNHVIAKLLQFKNVEIHQPMDLPDVEITKLQHVPPDVIQFNHLNHHNVTVKLKLLQDVDLD